MPVSGSDGSLNILSRLGIGRLIFIHVNNTNPMLIDGSPERRDVEAANAEVAYDGMEITL
jgi:pyrroloquinoline quinone biosynthesis protein B